MFEKSHKEKNKSEITDIDFEKTSEERIEQALDELNANIASELLEHVTSSSPSFFEHLVVELLVRMGYGGSRKEAGQVVGKAGASGIDGIIKEDKLGLDTIYMQAKKWENVVSRPEIQKFVGALQGNRAKRAFLSPRHGFRKRPLIMPTRSEITSF